MSLWYVTHLNTYLDLGSYLKDTKIRFNCKLNLTSLIDDLANHNIYQAMFPTIMPWPMTLMQLPFLSPFAIAVAITVAITITVAIADAVITISPLVCPLCLLIVVLSGGQSHCYQ
jgi:hypothetical protein